MQHVAVVVPNEGSMRYACTVEILLHTCTCMLGVYKPLMLHNVHVLALHWSLLSYLIVVVYSIQIHSSTVPCLFKGIVSIYKT